MNDYRNQVDNAARETRWTFWRFLPIVLIIIAVLMAVGFGLKSMGMLGSTIVERKVFENSYQYHAGMAERAAILQANIFEIDTLLSTNPTNREELIGQRSVLRVQLNAITINK